MLFPLLSPLLKRILYLNMHILRTDLFSDLKGGKLNFLSFSIAFKRTIKLPLLVHVLFDATQRELTEGPASEPENLLFLEMLLLKGTFRKHPPTLFFTLEDNLQFCILLDPVVLLVSHLKG